MHVTEQLIPAHPDSFKVPPEETPKPQLFTNLRKVDTR